MYVCSLRTPVASRAGVFGFWRLDLDNVQHFRSMASLCRLKATLDPENGSRWQAHADRWEALAQAEIDERYRECNVGRDELVA
jgi:hypothetical protein